MGKWLKNRCKVGKNGVEPWETKADHGRRLVGLVGNRRRRGRLRLAQVAGGCRLMGRASDRARHVGDMGCRCQIVSGAVSLMGPLGVKSWQGLIGQRISIRWLGGLTAWRLATGGLTAGWLLFGPNFGPFYLQKCHFLPNFFNFNSFFFLSFSLCQKYILFPEN